MKNSLVNTIYYSLPNNGSQEGINSTTRRMEEAKTCAQIAEEFAIGFADWKDKFISEVGDWKQDGVYLKNSYTTKELLEIYKKEKKL